MSQDSPKKPEETYPLQDMNNKSDETTPLTKPDENVENNVNNETSGLEEKLSLEKDTEAGQTSKRKSITAAIIAAEDILENPKIRLILAVVCAILLFLFVLVVAIVIIANESDDDQTKRFIRIIPRPKGPFNLLYYRHGDLKEEEGVRSWIDMVKEIDTFLAPYRRPENATLCPFSSKRNTSDKQAENAVCLFDLNTVAKECLQSDYGYMAGRPCIFIVFNNITDWIPELGTNGNTTEAFNPSIVGLECNANTQFDLESIGPMEFTPYQGFSPIFFPYKGQHNYMAPFVALRLPAPTHSVGIGLTCRIVAKNVANETDSTASEPFPFIPFNIFIE